VVAKQPAFSANAYVQTLFYKAASDRDRHRQSLVKAGLPT
jgi:hypothetical protein